MKTKPKENNLDNLSKEKRETFDLEQNYKKSELLWKLRLMKKHYSPFCDFDDEATIKDFPLEKLEKMYNNVINKIEI